MTLKWDRTLKKFHWTWQTVGTLFLFSIMQPHQHWFAFSFFYLKQMKPRVRNFIFKGPVTATTNKSAPFKSSYSWTRKKKTKGIRNNSKHVKLRFLWKMQHVMSEVLCSSETVSQASRHPKTNRRGPLASGWTVPDRRSDVTEARRCWGDVADSELSLPKASPVLDASLHIVVFQIQFAVGHMYPLRTRESKTTNTT